MDPFAGKDYRPMLIRDEAEPFDDLEWIFELKLDGISALAYLDRRQTVLVNRSGRLSAGTFPELSNLHEHVEKQCIIHGEITAMGKDGKPDFERVLRRSATSGALRIRIAAGKNPVEFVAYDLLYIDGEDILKKPLMERKELLEKFSNNGGGLSLSPWIEERGKAVFALAVAQGLEGVVGKRKNSLYYPGKRSGDWVKIKNLHDDDFVVCGYIRHKNSLASVVLGQYSPQEILVYKGHATLGVARKEFAVIRAHPEQERHPFAKEPPKNNAAAQWIRPDLVCVVQFAERTGNGGLRQPVFKGLRDDKPARDVVEKGMI